MATQSEKVKLGIFLTVGGAIFAGSFALLTGSKIWEERDNYVIRFNQSVSGIQPGSPVKQQGVRVGYVDDIKRDKENFGKVKVRIKVEPNTPIKTNTKATLNMQGITGLKFIELDGGTENADRLDPRSEIETGTTTLQELSGRASDIGMKFEKLLNNLLTLTRPENRRKFDEIVTKSKDAVTKFNSTAKESERLVRSAKVFLDDTREPLERALKSVEKTSDSAKATLVSLRKLVTRAETEIAEANLPEAVDEIRGTNQLVQDRIEGLDAGSAIENVTVALETVQRVLGQISETIGQNQHALRVMVHNLRTVSENLKRVSRTFQEKPFIQLFERQPAKRQLPESK